MNCALRPPRTVRGRVVDWQYAPVGGAQITFGSESTSSHADGSFRLRGPTAVRGSLMVTKRGFGLTPSELGDDLLIVLRPSDRAAGDLMIIMVDERVFVTYQPELSR